MIPLALLVACVAGLDAVSTLHPTWLGPLGPYECSPSVLLTLGGLAILYRRGAALGPAPTRRRQWLFYGALALFWAVLQTRFAYLAQHMFALTRVVHLVTHHLAPFLLALSWPWPVIGRAIPTQWRRRAGPTLACRLGRRAFNAVQQPAPASILFVGLIALWLTPPVQFRTMFNRPLYATMNWSMAVDGVLFWSMLLEPSPEGSGALSLPVRMLIALGVQMPQIMLGAAISMVGVDLYPAYDLCGRMFPAVGPLLDQEIGGFIVWYVAGMMSALTALLLLRRLRAATASVAVPALS